MTVNSFPPVPSLIISQETYDYFRARQREYLGYDPVVLAHENQMRALLSAAEYIFKGIVDEAVELYHSLGKGVKPWMRSELRNQTIEERNHTSDEGADVFIWWLNVMIILGYSCDEINNSILGKLRINASRPDHDINKI